MLSDEIQKVEIDEKKLNQIKNSIISFERENIKTGEHTVRDMVNTIRRVIEKIVE